MKKRGPSPSETILSDSKPAPPIAKATTKLLNKKIKSPPKSLTHLTSDEIDEITATNVDSTNTLANVAESNTFSDESGLLNHDDMMWLFKNWGGKRKLLRKIKDDPQLEREFMTTILKGQLKSYDAKARASAAGSQQKEGRQKTRLFVVKGLYTKDDPNSASSTKIKEEQILNILNPSESKKTYNPNDLVIPGGYNGEEEAAEEEERIEVADNGEEPEREVLTDDDDDDNDLTWDDDVIEETIDEGETAT